MNDDVTPAKATKGHRTQLRILQAALELFGEQGFAATSVRDIASRAGLTHAGLLHHFPSKDGMLVRILQFREEQDASLVDKYSGAGDDQLFAWILDVIEANILHPDRVHLFVKLSAEATTDDHPAHDYFVKRYARVVGIIADAFTVHFSLRPPVVEIAPLDAARALVALMDGLQIQWLLFPGEVDMPALVRTHLRALGVVLD